MLGVPAQFVRVVVRRSVHVSGRFGVPEPAAGGPDLHADLHAKNLIWSSQGWCVLDLDGVRHGLHALRRRKITENLWARLLLDFEDSEQALELYREFLRLCGQPWDVERSWERILKGFDEVLRKRGLPPVAPPRPL